MRKIFYLAIATIFFASCANTNNFNSLNICGLKGHVKSVTSACYDASERFGEVQKGDLTETYDDWIPLCAGMILEFNEDGNLQKETYLNSRGDVLRLIRYEHQGINTTSMAMYGFDGELAYSWKTIFEDGKPVKLERYERYAEANDETIEYDFDGLCVTAERHFQNGVMTKNIKSVYKNNLLLQSITTDKDGNVTYQMDQDYTADGQFLCRHIVTDGEDGILENITYNEKALPIHYARSGKWSNGDVECEFEYTNFDKQGNWLTRIIKADNKPIGIQERTIEYY